MADVMTGYYALNFIRKPEFMGFNGYNDGIKRTEFNPLAWPSNGEPDQNRARTAEWKQLRDDEDAMAKSLPPQYASAFFELVGYPVEGSAAMNEKLLDTDLTYLDAHQHKDVAMTADAAHAQAAYDTIQTLTAQYNSLEAGKWDGMMCDHPRDRHVFEMPKLATAADADTPLPASWGAGDAACQGAGNTTCKAGKCLRLRRAALHGLHQCGALRAQWQRQRCGAVARAGGSGHLWRVSGLRRAGPHLALWSNQHLGPGAGTPAD